MSSISSLSPNVAFNIENQLNDLPQCAVASTFKCKNLQPADTVIIKALSKVFKNWKEAISDRLGNSRVQFKATQPHKFEDDQKTVKEYKELIGYFEQHLDIFKKDPSKFKILILTRDTHVQGLASVSNKVNHLYVHTLISAPWNIPMNGTVCEEHTPLISKGVGVALMKGFYLAAQKENLPSINLKPLSGSYTFYKDAIGMKEVIHSKNPDENDSYFELSVTPEIPQPLADRSKKLLHGIE